MLDRGVFGPYKTFHNTAIKHPEDQLAFILYLEILPLLREKRFLLHTSKWASSKWNVSP